MQVSGSYSIGDASLWLPRPVLALLVSLLAGILALPVSLSHPTSPRQVDSKGRTSCSTAKESDKSIDSGWLQLVMLGYGSLVACYASLVRYHVPSGSARTTVGCTGVAGFRRATNSSTRACRCDREEGGRCKIKYERQVLPSLHQSWNG